MAETAFAVYSADDNSLTFYKRSGMPTAGSIYEGKTATTVYTGIETVEHVSSLQDIPWHTDGNYELITSVVIKDEISPKQTIFWFFKMDKITSIDVTNINTKNCLSTYGMFGGCTSLVSINGLSDWDTSSITDMGGTFIDCFALTSIGDLSNWDTSSVTRLMAMFSGCTSLSFIGDLSNWNTSFVTDMSYLFNKCSLLNSLGDLSDWDTSSVVNMTSMFRLCILLTSVGDLSNWNTSKVTSFRAMFSGNNYIGDMLIEPTWVGEWDVSAATDLSYMFYGCAQTKTLDLSKWDVSNCTTFDHTFCDNFNLEHLDLSGWNTSNVETFGAMFNDCRKLTTIDVSSFDTSNAFSTGQMFENCHNLKNIIGLENFETSGCTGFGQMFCNCHSLKELDLSNFDTRAAYEYEADDNEDGMCDMFTNMYRLEKITFGENFSFTGTAENTGVSAILPTPSNLYIEEADGYWYNVAGEAFLPADIPSGVAGTYFAMNPILYTIYHVKHKNIVKIADAIRIKNGSSDTINVVDMPHKISGIFVGSYDVEEYKGDAEQANWTYPEKEGMSFVGWYADASCTEIYTGTTGRAFAKFIDTEDMLMFYGCSLRQDSEDVYTETTIRFGYLMSLPSDINLSSWGWKVGTSADKLSINANGSSYTTPGYKLDNSNYITNFTLTDISTSLYTTSLYIKMRASYITKDGTTVEAVGAIYNDSVQNIAQKIVACSFSETEVAYAQNILAQITS